MISAKNIPQYLLPVACCGEKNIYGYTPGYTVDVGINKNGDTVRQT